MIGTIALNELLLFAATGTDVKNARETEATISKRLSRCD